ncbi:MAG: hypothetical protein R6V19_15885 [Armatimonadota bacterium]
MDRSCSECKHWKKGMHWEDEYYEELGECRKIAKYGPATSHSLQAEDIHAEIKRTTDRVLALEKAAGSCHLVTGAEFGCVHWEAASD